MRILDDRLTSVYGGVRRRRTSPFDELVLTVLSQNTTDVNSARSFATLKRRFPDLSELAQCRPAAIAAAIRGGGLADVKARYLRDITRRVLAEGGDLSLSFLRRQDDAAVERWLTALPGVGPKTARVVMLFSLERDVFPVDTHILRLTRRLGFIPARASARRAHVFWDGACPPGRALSLHVNLIRHGRAVCHPRRPACGGCVLADLCPSREVGL